MNRQNEEPRRLDETVSLGKAANPSRVGIEALGAEQKTALFRSLRSVYAHLVSSASFREQHEQPTIGDFVKILGENIARLREAGPGANVAGVAQTLDPSIRPFFKHSITRPVTDLVKDMEAHLAALKTVDPSTKIIDIIVVDQSAKKPESKE